MWINLPDSPVPGASSSEGMGVPSPDSTASESEARSSDTPSTRRLIQALDRGLALLDSRGVPVSRRALVEAYARFLAAEALGLSGPEARPSSRESRPFAGTSPPPEHERGRTDPGHHARDPDGVRYWIAARRSGDAPREIVVPGIPHRAFDRILVVRFDARFGVEFACAAPATAFLRSAAYREEANEWALGLSHSFWRGASVENLTILFRITVRRLEVDDTSEGLPRGMEPGGRLRSPMIREPRKRPRRRSRERTGEAERADPPD